MNHHTRLTITFTVKHSFGLPIAHVNIRGIINKIDELKLHISNLQLKILHISESFLTSNLSSNLLCVPNFNLHRRDRLERHGGGLLTYIHSSLNCSVLTELEPILPETLTFKISQHTAKPFITSVIYRPPNSPASWFDQFTLFISKCKEICDDVIIMGDFNINLNKPHNKWSTVVNQLNLLQLIQQPTRVQANSQSLIDHIYVTKPMNISQHGTYDIGLSDHHMIHVTRKLGTKTLSPKPRHKICYLDWNHFSAVEFQNSLNDIHWDNMYLTSSVDEMLEIFNKQLHEVVSKHLKQKTRFVKSSILPPWLDHEVQHNIKLRDSIDKANDWASYKHQRNYTTNLIKRKKREHVKHLVSSSKDKQTKLLWQTLRNTAQSSVTPNLSHGQDSSPIQTCDLNTANQMNKHFACIIESLGVSDPPLLNTSPASTIPIIPSTLSSIPHISPPEVLLLFNKIQITKATGIDNLSVKILQLAMPFIINQLTDILNRSISEGVFPTQWKTSIVTPLHKGGDPNNPSNYRPISVLPILSKIYERHILNALQNYLNAHNIISNTQSGFRKQHSCTTTLHFLHSTWLDLVSKRHHLALLFLDFHKAFDMVSHEILLTKLKHVGIAGNCYSILQSFLSGRHQCVKINKSISATLAVSRGVPQGSILSPTLFQIFINDLLSLPLHCTAHAYADDTSFFASNSCPKKLQTQIDHDLSVIEDWCSANQMLINVNKSHFLIVNPPKDFTFSLKINGHQIQKKTSSKLLGYMINDSLTWHDHIQHITNKVSSNLRLLYNLRHLMNYDTAKLYYFNFIHSHLIYGIHLYHPLSPARLTDPLFKLQKRSLRAVCRHLAPRSHTKTVSTKRLATHTNVLPLPSLSNYFTSLIGHNIQHGRCPPYLTDIYTVYRNTRSTRERHKLPSSCPTTN